MRRGGGGEGKEAYARVVGYATAGRHGPPSTNGR